MSHEEFILIKKIRIYRFKTNNYIKQDDFDKKHSVLFFVAFFSCIY